MTFLGSVGWQIDANADTTVNIEVPGNEHVVYFTLGAGTLYRVDDSAGPGMLDLPPIQRAVIVARLRAIADVLESEAAPA